MLWAAAVVAFFSLIGFWLHDKSPLVAALLFMLAAGSSLMVGLQWYDVYVTATGLSISLMLISYCFVCFGIAFALIVFVRKEREE